MKGNTNQKIYSYACLFEKLHILTKEQKQELMEKLMNQR